MPSALDRIDIAPPPDAGAIRSFGLALLIHAALIIALTWGVNWKRSDTAATFGAELWANAPQEVAPITPAREEAAPLPTPVVKQPVLQTPPEQSPNVDIALEQEKKRKQLKDQQVAREKTERDKAQLLKAEQLKAEQLAKAEQAKADALKTRQSQQSAVKQRDDNLKRLNELMTSAGGGAQGSTSRATAGGKGTSTTYGAIATAAVKPNVVFTEAFDGNPLAKIEVRLQLDGTIISSRVVQASGNDNWDKAVLNAVIRTGRMPKDVDGKLPDTILILEFKPRF